MFREFLAFYRTKIISILKCIFNGDKTCLKNYFHFRNLQMEIVLQTKYEQYYD